MSGNSFKLLMKCPPSSVAAPTNTVAPSIGGTAQVGSTLSGNDGTWTGSPTYSRQWKADGANIAGATGTTYVPVTGDIGKVITFAVTGTNVGGSAAGTSSATSAVVAAGTKALAATSISIGQWTKAGRGHVPLSNIMVPAGNDIPVSWTIGTATSGTDGHWTKISAGTAQASGNAYTPYPSTSGDTAELSSGTYVFPVTATYVDASTDTKNLTITIVADAASMGHYDTFDKANIIGAGTIAAWEAQSGNQKSLLISTGVNHTSKRNGGTSFNFTSMVRIRHADPARPSVFSTWECGDSSYCQWEGIVLTGDVSAAAMPLGSSGLWHFKDGSTRTNCALIDCGVDYGSAATCSPSLGSLQFFGTNTDIQVTRFVALWNENGIKDKPSAINTRITFDQCTIRYFFDNAVFISNPIDWVFNDLVTASPRRRPHGSGHVDHFQIQDDLGTERVVNLTINRYTCIDADGDAYSGGVFGLRGSYTINGYCYLGRSNHALTLSGLESGASQIKNFTMIKGYGQTFNTDAPVSVDDTEVKIGDPNLRTYGSTTYSSAPWSAGTLTVSNGIIQDMAFYSEYIDAMLVHWPGIQPPTLTIAPSAHFLGVHSQTQPDPAFNAYFPSDPRPVYDAKTTAQWAAMDRAALIAFAKTVATPKSGVTAGAFADTGAWNT